MKLPENKFKKAILAHQPQVGIWNSMSCATAAEILATSDFDWACIDMEHSPNTISDVADHLRIYSGEAVHPMVRTPWNDQVWIKHILDVGAMTLLVPMVQNKEEAIAAVAATRYPPSGVRGVAGLHRGTRFGRIEDYFARVHAEMCVIVQIESKEALENVEEIAAVDGVDGIFFGPADISADMGLIGQTNHPDLWAEISTAAEKVKAIGKPIGTLVLNPTKAAALLEDGFTFVACGVDSGLLATSADALVARIKNRGTK